MADFKSLLAKPITSAERPKPKAPGQYFGQVMGHKFDESTKKKTPFVRFDIGNISPGPEVDMELNAQNNVDLTKWRPHFDFYLTEDSLYRLREFIESCGIPIEGRGFAEAIPELKGKPIKFIAVNTTSESDGKTEVYTNVDSIAGA